jgi:hypothetical protein
MVIVFRRDSFLWGDCRDIKTIRSGTHFLCEDMVLIGDYYKYVGPLLVNTLHVCKII